MPNAALGTAALLETGFVLLWLVPYTSSLKMAIVRRIAHSRSLAWGASWLLPLVMAGQATAVAAELRRWHARHYARLLHAAVHRGGGRALTEAVDARVAGSSRMWLGVFGLLLSLFTSRAFYLARTSLDALVDLEMRALEHQMLAWRPPSVAALGLATAAYRSFFSPVFVGWERLPDDRPLLFVSNHTILGLDLPLVLYELYRRRGIFARVLADHVHFQLPSGAALRSVLGAVDGTPRNVDLLMESGACLFVYPGGARETFKRTTDERYALMWGDHLGFARCAIKHGATIVPVTNLGSEDVFTVALDLPTGWLPAVNASKVPLLKPPTPGQLQRLYFEFGEPIRTDVFAGDFESRANCELVRDRAHAAIEEGLQSLRALRAEDPNRRTLDRIGWTRFSNWVRRSAGFGSL